MTNSSGANLDVRRTPERASPWMDLINGSMTGSHVGATRFNDSLTRETVGRVIGAPSFLVTSCGASNKSFVHGRTYAAIAWMRRSSELAG